MNHLTTTSHQPGTVLQGILGENATLEPFNAVPQSQQFIALGSSNRLRWLLPAHPDARYFMESWAPQGFLRGLAWRGVCKVHHHQLSRLLPGCSAIGVSGVDIHEWTHQLFGGDQQGLPAIYVGTEGPRRKAVVGLVNKFGCEQVAKLAIGEEAATAIRTETNGLQTAQHLLGERIPRLIGYDSTKHRSVQSFIHQPLCFSPWGQAHTEVLNLLQTEETASLRSQMSELHDAAKPEEHQLIERFLSRCPSPVLERPLKLNRVHGDFIPWNLKVGSDPTSPLSVIDWEYYRPRGLPLSDFAFFTYFTLDFLSPKNIPSNPRFLKSINERSIVEFAIRSGLTPPDLPWVLVGALIENALARRQAGHEIGNAVVSGLLSRAAGLLNYLEFSTG